MPSVYDILKISAYYIGHIISESLATLIFEKIPLLGSVQVLCDRSRGGTPIASFGSQCSHDHDKALGGGGEGTMKT